MSITAQGAVGAETMTAGQDDVRCSYCGLLPTPASEFECVLSSCPRRAALASPRADSDERTTGEALKEACKPWEHYTGEPPDDGSPLSGVFVAGMVYTERLLAKLLDVTHYEGGDGSEDFDSDATQTLRNILTGARLWDEDENRPVSATPAQPAGAVPDSLRALSEAGAEAAIEAMADAIRNLRLPDDEGRTIQWRFNHHVPKDIARVAYRALLPSHPAGQSAGSGETIAVQKRDLVKMVDAAFAVDPSVPTEAQGDNLFAAATKLASYLPLGLECTGCGSRESIEAIQARGFSSCCPERKMQPAPDSTRTGQGEAEERLIGPKMTPEQEARIAHNLCGEFGPDAVIANASFVKAFYAELYAAARPAAPEAQGAETFQARADRWLEEVTEGDPTDLPERRDRYSEESLELVQALGATREGMHQLVDYVFSRPVGEPGDEMGDTKLCLANLASWAKLNMDACGETMLARRSKPESVAKIRRKRSTRHGRGPLPGLDAPAPPASSGQGGR